MSDIRKIIVTGASGFVGQNISKYFKQQGYAIQKLSLRGENWKSELDMDSHAMIHLAGKAHDTAGTSNETEYFTVNLNLTIAAFELFLSSKIRDFFYFSSVKAVADSVGDILKEETIAAPSTPYGRSKLEAEKYLLGQPMLSKKRLFIIRPCMIHGPGNKGNLNLLYKVVQKGVPWPLADFANQRSYLSIDNLNFLLNQMLINSDVSSGIYNFSDDEVLSTNELVSLISESLNRKIKLWHIPKHLIQKLARLGDIFPLPLNSERLKKLTESYVVSNYKVKSVLKVGALPLSAKDGMKKTINSFRV